MKTTTHKPNTRKAVMAGAMKHSEILNKKMKDPAYARRHAEAVLAAEVAEQLHGLREKKGLTQTQLGERIGINQQGVARIEKGQQNLTLGTIQRWAGALGYKAVVTMAPR